MEEIRQTTSYISQPMLNDGISTTNLKWWVYRISATKKTLTLYQKEKWIIFTLPCMISFW